MKLNAVELFKQEMLRWFKDEEKVLQYRNALIALEDSGVMAMLYRIGVPTRIGMGSDVNIMASEASHAAGYQQCLQHIKYFEELFREDLKTGQLGSADYGGDYEAIKRGDLHLSDIMKGL